MAYLKPTVVIVRAVGALFARRMLRIALLIGIGVAILLHGGGVWLVTGNPWWWLIESALILLTILFIVLVTVVLAILRVVEPPQTKRQKQAVSDFVDKFQRVAENLKTPMPLIVLFIVKDTIMPSKDGTFIGKMVYDSKSLAPDLVELHRAFDLPDGGRPESIDIESR